MTSRLSVALLALLAAPAWAQEVPVATAAGPVAVPANPDTVAVFDLAAADALDALGVPIAGMPADLRLPCLEDAAGAAAPVGTLFEPGHEALAALAPDLVVAGGRSAAVVEPLGRVAPTLDMTIPAAGHAAVARERLMAYGALFGREREAEALLAGFDAQLAEARAAVAGRGDALVAFVNGGRLSACGGGSRFGWLHEALGIPEAVEGLEAGTHGEAVSFEFLREADPDWLLVVDRGAAIGEAGEAAAAVLDNPVVAETTAWREGQVVDLDPARIYLANGGIQSMTGTLDEIVEAFGAAEPAEG